MLRRASALAPLAGCRTIIAFSQANPVLMNNATANGYKASAWIEESDVWWATNKANTKLKPNAKPTEVQMPKRLELYNFDQLVNAPERDNNVHWPHSHRTGRRYNGAFADKLVAAAAAKKYDSKWWVSAGEAKAQNLRTRENARPFVTIMKVQAKVYNADQFENPEAITNAPHSGAIGTAYRGENAVVLAEHMKANKFKWNIYFTEKQAIALGMPPKAGAVPATIDHAGSNPLRLYNLDEIVSGASLLTELNRSPVTEPTYLLSGKPLGEKWLHSIKDTKFSSKYWVTREDVTARKLALVDGAKGATFADQRTFQSTMFNAEQLNADIAEVLASVGTYVPAE